MQETSGLPRVIVCIFLLIGFSCHHPETRFSEHAAFQQAYDYFIDQQDSTKARAVVHLYRSAEGRQSETGARYDTLLRITEVLHRKQPTFDAYSATRNQQIGQTIDSLLRRHYHFLQKHPVRHQSDVPQLSKDFLIRHINESFRQWASPFASHLDEAAFYEYLLPYKSYRESLDTAWRRQTLAYHESEDTLRQITTVGDAYWYVYQRSPMQWARKLSFLGQLPFGVMSRTGFFRDCYDLSNYYVFSGENPRRSHGPPWRGDEERRLSALLLLNVFGNGCC